MNSIAGIRAPASLSAALALLASVCLLGAVAFAAGRDRASMAATHRGSGRGWTHASTAGVVAVAADRTSGPLQNLAGPVRGPLFIPDVGGPECDGRLAVQNLEGEPLKVAVLLFDRSAEPCSGPALILCGGLLSPGGSWHFEKSTFARAGSAVTARSAVVVGLSAKTRTELGLAAPDDVAADGLCADLRTAVTDCAAYSDFLEALGVGSDWRGWPLAEVAGLAIGAEMEMRCPSLDPPGTTITGAYSIGPGRTSKEIQHPSSSGEVWVQNAGDSVANVAVVLTDAESCTKRPCPGLTIAPGASQLFTMSGCPAPPGWALRLTSDGPTLASVAEQVGQHMSVEAGEPLFLDIDDPQSIRMVGPLVFDPSRDWSTRVEVTNLGAESATADVRFLDGVGRLLGEESLTMCGGATSAAVLAPTDDGAGLQVGSVVVTGVGVAPLRGAARAWREHAGPGRGMSASYPLVADPAEPALPGGRPSAIGLPLVEKDLDSLIGGTTEIALSNPSDRPGWIQAALMLYDQNDLVSVMCHTLVQRETRYVSLESFGAVDPGFRGSALIVPTAWSSSAGDVHAGVAAVVVHRFGTRLGEDVPGDEMAAAVGIPLEASAGVIEAAEGNCQPGGSYERVPSPPVFLPQYAAAVSYAPALTARLDPLVCDAGLTISNAANAPRTGLVLLFGREEKGCGCAPLLSVLVTNEIARGGSWTLNPADMPDGATSAAMYGFSSTATASAVLAALTSAGDCDSLREYHLNFGRGGSFHGIELGAAAAGGLSTRVTRICPSHLGTGRVGTSYTTPNHSVDGNAGTQRSLAFVAAEEEGNTFIYVQNTGFGCTDVALHFKARGDCLRERTCRISQLGPGESVAFPAYDCVGPSHQGSVVVEAREPIAVTAEWLQEDGGLISYGSFPGDQPADVNADGVTNAADLALVQGALGASPGTGAWRDRYDLRPDSIIDSRDAQTVTAALCGAEVPDPAPPAPKPDQHVLLPLLLNDDESCHAGITVQNLGAKETGVVLVFFGNATDATCAKPIAIMCSRPIASGGSWFLASSDIKVGLDDPTAGRIPRSAIAFSFNTGPAPVDVDIDYFSLMCEMILQGVLGDCRDYRIFKTAWDTGADFAGVRLDQVKGSPIAVSVTRDCADGDGTAVIDYSGVGTHQLVAGTREGPAAQWLPLVVNLPWLTTKLVVQNDSPRPATVQVTLRFQDDCSAQRACEPLTIAPGSSVEVACDIGVDSQGSARIESTEPVAAAAIISSPGEGIAAAYTALRALNSDALGRSADDAHLQASGLLTSSPVSGADTGVQVVNLSRERPAHVQAIFRYRAGETYAVLEDEICPDGSQTFFAPVEGVHAAAPASVEVRSVGYRAGGMTQAAPIAAIAITNLWAEAARVTQFGLDISELASGPLSGPHLEAAPAAVTPAPGEVIDEPVPDGVAVLAVTGLQHAPALTTNSQVVVGNRVGVDGYTDFAFTAFDVNGPVASRCFRLQPFEIVTIAPDVLRVPGNFMGGAVISATEWTHEVETSSGVRKLVGLSAELVRGFDPGSPSALDVGSIAAHPILGPGGGLTADVSCAPVPTATPTLVPPTPAPTWSVRLPDVRAWRAGTPEAP